MNRKSRRAQDKQNQDNPVEICKQALEFQRNGNLAKAESLYKKALALEKVPGAFSNLGNIYVLQNKQADALECFENALKLQPNNVSYLTKIASVAYQLGQYDKALSSLAHAMELDPGNDLHKVHMANLLQNAKIHIYNDKVAEILCRCLECQSVSHQNMIVSWISVFNLDPDLEHIHILSKSPNYDAFKDTINLDLVVESLSKPYVLLGFKRLIIANPGIEFFITYFRRYVLENIDTFDDSESLTKILAALAINSFTQEYVYSETEEEKAAYQKLTTLIEEGNSSQNHVLIRACYIPLHTLVNALDIADKYDENYLQDVTNLQIKEPIKEKEMAYGIKGFGDIHDDISQSVRAMYEGNPYPRWKSIDTKNIKEIPNTLDWLIAGCGTGRTASQTSITFPKAKITAVDLSKASLAYGMRKARQYGLDNISFKHGDILDLEKLGQKFDVIECSGVLHHMEDPVAGWKSLLSCLKPRGRMSIGLYSKTARENVIKAREYIEKEGFEPTEDGIRAFRQSLYTLGNNTPFKDLMHWRDFYSLSECRDLLFHIQEKCYTIQDLKSIFEELQLDFLGFHFPLPQIPQLYAQHFSDDKAMLNLDNWQKLEETNPAIFRGMYQFWCCRKGAHDIKDNALNLIGLEAFYKRLAGTTE